MTGGGLRTDKSWYYLVDYVWKRSRWVASDLEVVLDLEASDMSGDGEKLTHLRSNEAADMLGVWIVLDGNRKN